MLGHQFVVKNSRVWHPNTQMSEWSGFDKITNAKGMYLYDSRGRKYIDGVASMWCNVWGHSKSELVSAIKTQSSKLQHSPMFNLTNEPTELLAKLLVNQSPGMSHVFFSDNGSTSMEIAAKMAMQYWSNIGEPRTKIASLNVVRIGFMPPTRHTFDVHTIVMDRAGCLDLPHQYLNIQIRWLQSIHVSNATSSNTSNTL